MLVVPLQRLHHHFLLIMLADFVPEVTIQTVVSHYDL